jgi:DNA polymerase
VSSVPTPPSRTTAPEERRSAADFLPPRRSLSALRRAASGCRGCALWARATQTVFGEGRSSAILMLVGETPGNDEDLAGRPFVGPAGRLLDRALAQSGIDRRTTYVTNVVKHFKWERSGKRRLHRRPDPREIRACRPWLDAELAAVQPAVLVCLGATAAQALLGRDFRVTRSRGEFVSSPLAPHVLATIHPSAILRGPPEEHRRELDRFVGDLRKVSDVLRRVS